MAEMQPDPAVQEIARAARRHTWDKDRRVWTMASEDYLALLVALHAARTRDVDDEQKGT